MKKRLKWLLVGSLMCLVVGSVFHQGYGGGGKLEVIDLPDETIFQIMTYLDPKDVVHFGATCKGIHPFSQDKILWKQKAFEAGISKIELEKVKKGFFTYKQLVIGYEYWKKFNEIKNSEDIADEKKLTLLKDAAGQGSEAAISNLLEVYEEGLFGLGKNNSEGLMLTKKYADLGSEVAKCFLKRNK